MTPAPGQGCLALEARADDDAARAAAERLTDRRALVELTAERAVVTRLGATCHTPVGARAELDGDRAAAGGVRRPAGRQRLGARRARGRGRRPGGLGREVAERMLAAGAAELLAAAEGAAA